MTGYGAFVYSEGDSTTNLTGIIIENTVSITGAINTKNGSINIEKSTFLTNHAGMFSNPY